MSKDTATLEIRSNAEKAQRKMVEQIKLEAEERRQFLQELDAFTTRHGITRQQLWSIMKNELKNDLNVPL